MPVSHRREGQPRLNRRNTFEELDCGDRRCELALGDFFAMAASQAIDPHRPGRQVHGIFVDIDHSPRHVLSAGSASFYEPDGLRSMATHLRPGGVFALWSDDAPDEELMRSLREVFTSCEARVVEFPNPLLGTTASCTIYLATLPLPSGRGPGRGSK